MTDLVLLDEAIDLVGGPSRLAHVGRITQVVGNRHGSHEDGDRDRDRDKENRERERKRERDRGREKEVVGFTWFSSTRR
jgi:hypothetical protein